METPLFNIIKKTKRTEANVLRKAGYSKKAVRLLDQRLNFGTMGKPDITAKHQSDCGDMLILYLKLENQKISNATYEYVGCRGLEAAASALTEMIKGKTMQEASKIGFLDVLTFLEVIPPSKYECIHLALNTLREGTKELQ
jgi:NifU-like protein involved in Fe-S cluster formation